MAEVGAAQRSVRTERTRTTRGFAIPSPAAQRFTWKRTVMASPPTITLGTYGANPTISGKTFAESNAAFRYFGATAPVLQNTFFYQAAPNTSYWAVDFEIDCQAFEFESQASAGAAKFRLIVDGEYHDADVELGQTGAGGYYWCNVAFGSKAIRHVIIEGDLNFKFGGVRVANTDHVWRSSTPMGPQVAWLGDSLIEGSMDGTTYGPYGLAVEASRWLGWRDVQCDGQGGTGYLKSLVSPARQNYTDRLSANIITPAPDIVIVWGGNNDTGSFTAQQIGDAAAALYNAIRTGVPAATLIVAGPYNSSGSPQSAVLAVRDAIQTAASGRAHLFIDTIVATTAGASTEGWITGTGQVSTETGEGNSDIYVSSDEVHPTRTGHAYIGRRFASAVNMWIEAGCPFGAVHAGNALTVP